MNFLVSLHLLLQQSTYYVQVRFWLVIYVCRNLLYFGSSLNDKFLGGEEILLLPGVYTASLFGKVILDLKV